MVSTFRWRVLRVARAGVPGAVALLVLLASCSGMRNMHGTERVQGSLDEMSVGEFYQANCASCHGGSRQGGIGPSLVPSRLVESDTYYSDVIANGRAGTAMSAWADLGLTDADITALMEFLRTPPQ